VAADGFDAFGEGFGLEPDSIVRCGIFEQDVQISLPL
jgi:hypothetical protein